MKQPPSPRILIVRLSAMGDVLHAMPAVTALRAAHPDAYIAWAVEPAWAPLLTASPGTKLGDTQPLVDALHLIPFKKWARSPLSPTTLRETRAARRALAAARYDIAVDMQGSVRSAWAMRWTRAPRRIGEAIPREPLAKFLFNERVPHRGTHVIEQDIELADAIFSDAPSLAYLPPLFPIDQAAEAWADAQLAQHSAARYAVLLPGAGWGSKRWPPARYGEVAAALAQRGFHAFINIGPEEQQLGEATVTASKNAASKNSASVLPATLAQLIAILRRASLAIGGDTGPLHLASALQVPTVGIYGPTDPARNGPYHSPHRVLRHPESRRDHGRHHKPEAGLLTITPDQVLAAVDDLLREVSA
jgi:heptosyltransferase I